MKKYLLISTWLLSLILCWYITKTNVKPEIVIQKQDKIIYKLKKEIEVKDIKEKSRYIIRIPFTKYGITKNFALGMLIGVAL